MMLVSPFVVTEEQIVPLVLLRTKVPVAEPLFAPPAGSFAPVAKTLSVVTLAARAEGAEAIAIATREQRMSAFFILEAHISEIVIGDATRRMCVGL